MTSWLDGELLVKVPGNAALRADLGATLGRLNTALRGFRHTGADRTHRWDMQRFGDLRELLADLPPAGVLPRVVAALETDGFGRAADLVNRPGLRAALEDCLDQFDLVRPLLATVRRQVIHNDFHGHNLLSDGARITGILDFGGALTGPVAMDVAVAACYQLGGSGDVLAPALDVVAGYHAADPLQDAELPLVADLMAARVAARIIVSQWNAVREPANREYLLRRTPRAIEHFAALREAPPGEITERLRCAVRDW
jgi:Ser/Thr protein kinase RdoA (MazF antagonist)